MTIYAIEPEGVIPGGLYRVIRDLAGEDSPVERYEYSDIPALRIDDGDIVLIAEDYSQLPTYVVNVIESKLENMPTAVFYYGVAEIHSEFLRWLVEDLLRAFLSYTKN